MRIRSYEHDSIPVIANLCCPPVLLANCTIKNAFKLNFISKIPDTTTVTCHQLKRNFSLLHLKYVQSLTLKNTFVKEPSKSLKHVKNLKYLEVKMENQNDLVIP